MTLSANNFDNFLESNAVTGFYLGYLRGRNSSPPPPQIYNIFILLIILYYYHSSIYVSNFISEKSSRRDEVSAHTVTFLKIVSQNAPECISAHLHLKKFPGSTPPDPPRSKLVAFAHSGRHGGHMKLGVPNKSGGS